MVIDVQREKNRCAVEPGAIRYFEALTIQWLDRANTPHFVTNAIEQAIPMYNMTVNRASQRIYRIGIDNPLKKHRTPDFVSVRAMY